LVVANVKLIKEVEFAKATRDGAEEAVGVYVEES
jgi:hypothetical protein